MTAPPAVRIITRARWSLLLLRQAGLEALYRRRAARCGERYCPTEHESLSDGHTCPTCKAVL